MPRPLGGGRRGGGERREDRWAAQPVAGLNRSSSDSDGGSSSGTEEEEGPFPIRLAMCVGLLLGTLCLAHRFVWRSVRDSNAWRHGRHLACCRRRRRRPPPRACRRCCSHLIPPHLGHPAAGGTWGSATASAAPARGSPGRGSCASCVWARCGWWRARRSLARVQAPLASPRVVHACAAPPSLPPRRLIPSGHTCLTPAHPHVCCRASPA